ncbi:MAG TPA: hypothetical protein VHB98_22645 [Chloroflexota bacterium]|jgi:hypothetical protein|nr:hypothetical protein [Chloroflexota bacterium]
MADSALNEVRRTLAEISESILQLPEVRPSQLPAAGTEAIAALIRACDVLIAALTAHPVRSPEADELLTGVRAQRRLLFLVLAEARPDQARFWTEEHRLKDPATDAKIAAGLIPRFYTDQEFEATLRAQWLGESDT